MKLQDRSAPPSRRVWAFIGCILLAWPLLGSSENSILTIIAAFIRLSETGMADPSKIAGSISMALLTTLYRSIYGTVGATIVSLVLFRKINREKWFYRCVTILSKCWCLLLFPFGSVIGIYLLIVFGRRKREFHPRPEDPSPSGLPDSHPPSFNTHSENDDGI